MGGTNHACLDALRKYVQDESLDKKKQAYDMSGWHLECVKVCVPPTILKVLVQTRSGCLDSCMFGVLQSLQDIPQQMNGSDCGVFTCKYAEYISRDAPFSFTQVSFYYGGQVRLSASLI